MIYKTSQTDTEIALFDRNGNTTTYTITDAINLYNSQPSGLESARQQATLDSISSIMASAIGTIDSSQLTISIDFVNQKFISLLLTT